MSSFHSPPKSRRFTNVKDFEITVYSRHLPFDSVLTRINLFQMLSSCYANPNFLPQSINSSSVYNPNFLPQSYPTTVLYTQSKTFLLGLNFSLSLFPVLRRPGCSFLRVRHSDDSSIRNKTPRRRVRGQFPRLGQCLKG